MSCKEISALQIGLANCLGDSFTIDTDKAKQAIAEVIDKEPEIKAVADAKDMNGLIAAFDGVVTAVEKRVDSTSEDDAHLSYRKALLLTVKGLSAQLKGTKGTLDNLQAGIDSVNTSMHKVYKPHPHGH